MQGADRAPHSILNDRSTRVPTTAERALGGDGVRLRLHLHLSGLILDLQVLQREPCACAHVSNAMGKEEAERVVELSERKASAAKS